MEHLIDKDALAAEIEKLKEEVESQDFAAYTEAYIVGVKHTLETISDILDALEVKDVDLEKEINTYISNNFFGSETIGFYANRTKEEPNDQDIALCAKYFFELGIKKRK
jgi:hypothetical protein